MNIKIKRFFMLHTVCRVAGHKSNGTLAHNGFVKGTYKTHKQAPLYQKKCDRCNRFYGEKIK